MRTMLPDVHEPWRLLLANITAFISNSTHGTPTEVVHQGTKEPHSCATTSDSAAGTNKSLPMSTCQITITTHKSDYTMPIQPTKAAHIIMHTSCNCVHGKPIIYYGPPSGKWAVHTDRTLGRFMTYKISITTY